MMPPHFLCLTKRAESGIIIIEEQRLRIKRCKMDYIQNLHTHTCYGDGKDTPEEMLISAIDKGFTSIGFSGHSYMYYAPTHSMSLESTEEYIKQIKALKSKYSGKIDVYLGLELDMFSKVDLSEYEYLIGSVHYFDIDGEKVGFDRSAAQVKDVIDTYFCGDGMAYAKRYYETLSRLPEYANIDIIGHFDLITKHCENERFFDETSKEYLSYAFECARALRGRIPFFEVNTGAISRGYRSTPYPSEPILKELLRLGFGAVISSDCHDRNQLERGFELSRELLLSCGYKERYILTDSGFTAVAL